MINSNIHYHDEYIYIIGNFTYIFCNIDNLTNKTKKSTNQQTKNQLIYIQVLNYKILTFMGDHYHHYHKNMLSL